MHRGGRGAPIGTPIHPKMRAASKNEKGRSTIANMFRTKNPSLSSERALLAANVALQIVKAMRTLYSESEAKARPLIEAEFRKVLASYLKAVLSEAEPAG